jgi:hypothetical protein
MSDLDRIRKLAGILTESKVLKEEMAQAQKVRGKWTDGTYTEGDAVTIRGMSMNLEWEAGRPLNDDGSWTEGAWYAVGDDGDEVEFLPGMEDRHDPMTQKPQMFPENDSLSEAPHGRYSQDEEVVKKMVRELHKMVDRVVFLAAPGGPLEKRVNALGGDPVYVGELRSAADSLADAIDNVDYGARGHLSAE